MTDNKKEMIKRVAVIYGEDSKVTEGFKEMCETNAVTEAHLEMVAWYMGCSRVAVLKKQGG